MSTITSWTSHDIQAGDTITITLPDRRKWKRLLHWLMRWDPPMTTKTLTVTASSITTMETKP